MKRIEKLLKNELGNTAEFVRELKVSRQTVDKTIKRDVNTPKTKKRYTNAFNKCFNKAYTYEELFEEVQNES